MFQAHFRANSLHRRGGFAQFAGDGRGDRRPHRGRRSGLGTQPALRPARFAPGQESRFCFNCRHAAYFFDKVNQKHLNENATIVAVLASAGRLCGSGARVGKSRDKMDKENKGQRNVQNRSPKR